MMTEFVPGRELSEGFFLEIAEPILRAHFPQLKFSAGFLGYGSDVIGYDDVISTDHMWGPRFYLFLTDTDIARKPELEAVFARTFPYTYRGYSVNFSAPDPNDGGVRHAQPIDTGEVSPLIFIYTVDGFLAEYLGVTDLTSLDALDWLTLPEHRLLALSQSLFFVDDLGFGQRLAPLNFYPDDVARYLIASQWSLLAEEHAFVTRTGVRGDEIGARIIAARMVERLMRLCFLYCRRYAPYSKWFGTAFARLEIDSAIGREIAETLAAADVASREAHLVAAQLLVVDLHNQRGYSPTIWADAQSYFSRPIQVIRAGAISEEIAEQLAGTSLERLPLIGTLSQVGNFTAISDNPAKRRAIRQLYGDSTQECGRQVVE